MNILIIGKFTAGQFGYHISYTLNNLGHNTLEFDPTLKIKYTRTLLGRRVHQLNQLIYNNLINTKFFREQRIKKLARLLEKFKVDLTISTHDFLYPDEVDFIKTKTKAPVVMWFPDSVAGFHKGLFFISDYDFLFFKDPYVVNVLTEQYNLHDVFYLPECCNPLFHKPIELTTNDLEYYGCDITTYGSPHNIRSSFFSQLTGLNYLIKIWGHQTPIWLNDKIIEALYTGVYVFNESKAKAVLASKINLNTLLPTEIYGLNARAFEIAGIGGFQMIHWRAGLEELFEDGKEIVSFNTFDELIEKIKYYFNKPEERNAIAKAGQIKAYNNHTYELRLKLLIDTVFNNAKGFQTSLIN